MKKQISDDQLVAVINLSNYPEIDHVSISSSCRSDRISISVSAVLDAKIELVVDRLLTIFPTVVNEGRPFNPGDKGNGVLTLLYGLNVGAENVSLTLHAYTTLEMIKAPLPEGATQEISHLDCSIDVSKVEPLVDRVWAEEIMRSVDNA